jgi:hypothetical protein
MLIAVHDFDVNQLLLLLIYMHGTLYNLLAKITFSYYEFSLDSNEYGRLWRAITTFFPEKRRI